MLSRWFIYIEYWKTHSYTINTHTHTHTYTHYCFLALFEVGRCARYYYAQLNIFEALKVVLIGWWIFQTNQSSCRASKIFPDQSEQLWGLKLVVKSFNISIFSVRQPYLAKVLKWYIYIYFWQNYNTVSIFGTLKGYKVYMTVLKVVIVCNGRSSNLMTETGYPAPVRSACTDGISGAVAESARNLEKRLKN